MTLVLERIETQSPDAPPSRSFELKVSLGKTPSFGFVVDPTDRATGAEPFRRALERIPKYFDWVRVPSQAVLSLVDDLVPPNPELLPPQASGLLVSPMWTAHARSVGVLVNTAFRRSDELLVRVPAWAKYLMGYHSMARWVALQPHISLLGDVVMMGVEAASAGRNALEIIVSAERFNAEKLRRIATLAGAPSGELLHLWRTLAVAGGQSGGPSLVSLKLTGKERIDVGVTFPASRVGTSGEIQRRLHSLSSVYELDETRYRESLDELTRLTGGAPAHTALGFSSQDGGVVLTTTFESVAAHQGLSRVS